MNVWRFIYTLYLKYLGDFEVDGSSGSLVLFSGLTSPVSLSYIR